MGNLKTCSKGCPSKTYRRGVCSPCYRDLLGGGDFSRPSIAGDKNPKWDGGASEHELSDIYRDMVARCRRETHARYPDYGGRGIDVCQEWVDDFWQFVADVGERPEGKTKGGRAYWQLDRIDNDGNYEPGNVRWATPEQQAINKRGFGDFESRRDKETGRFT